MQRRLKTPVGLIDTSWGGTMAQHWVTKKTLGKIAEVKPYLDKFQGQLTRWNEGGREAGAKRRYEADLKAWETKRAAARAKGQRIRFAPTTGP